MIDYVAVHWILLYYRRGDDRTVIIVMRRTPSRLVQASPERHGGQRRDRSVLFSFDSGECVGVGA